MKRADPNPCDDGYRDYHPERRPQFPDNDDYMSGWSEAEHWHKLSEEQARCGRSNV
jgi:hypothetical protein